MCVCVCVWIRDAHAHMIRHSNESMKTKHGIMDGENWEKANICLWSIQHYLKKLTHNFHPATNNNIVDNLIRYSNVYCFITHKISLYIKYRQTNTSMFLAHIQVQAHTTTHHRAKSSFVWRKTHTHIHPHTQLAIFIYALHIRSFNLIVRLFLFVVSLSCIIFIDSYKLCGAHFLLYVGFSSKGMPSVY